MLDDLDLSGLPDQRTRDLVLRLLNLIETVTADLRAAQAENQRLRDELNRLKGEQGKPDVKPNARPKPPAHIRPPRRLALPSFLLRLQLPATDLPIELPYFDSFFRRFFLICSF